jgi:hypothetical protein
MDPVRELDEASQDVEAAQKKTLAWLTERGSRTAYGREHGIRAGMSYGEYASKVPVADYLKIKPYVDRAVEQDERFGLIPEEIEFFSTSSATTGGAKYVPAHEGHGVEMDAFYTLESYFRNKENPGLEGPIIPVVGRMHRLPTGKFYGSNSGWYFHRLVKRGDYHEPIPYEAHQLAPPVGRSYAVLSFALRVKLRQLFQTNPSGILVYAQRLAADSEHFIRDLRDGGISHPEIPEELAAAWKPLLPKDPARAKELEQARARDGNLMPTGAWPSLGLVRCWIYAGMGLYREELQRNFPGVTLWDFGYNASEGRLTVTANHQGQCLPILTSVFFELRYADGEVKPWHLVREGDEGELIISNSRGLFRYTLGDVIGVMGRHRATPLVQFRRRVNAMGSFTGEKITEEQVIDVTQKALATLGLKAKFFSLAPVWSTPPRWRLIVEFAGAAPDVKAERRLAAELERLICEKNPEYVSKRETQRLGPCGLYVIAPGEHDAYLGRLAASGREVGRIKLPRVSMDVKLLKELNGREVDAET